MRRAGKLFYFFAFSFISATRTARTFAFLGFFGYRLENEPGGCQSYER
jgi:hypothetical protein